MNKLWFKAKRYGWGWTPVSWEGWVLTFAYIFLLINIFKEADRGSHSGSDTLIGIALPFIILTSLFLLICYKKGETPGWHWGNKGSDNLK